MVTANLRNILDLDMATLLTKFCVHPDSL